MSDARADALIDALAADARPVAPMVSPGRRAGTTLAAMALAGAIAVFLLADPRRLLAIHAGREAMLMAEMAAMGATGVLAVAAAFFASIPGRSRRWLAAPMPFLALWLLQSGIGGWHGFAHGASESPAVGESMNCFLFIGGVSAALAPPLLWRLARATPVDPVPVALLGGLGIAASAAFLLQFFHPFAITPIDLAVHAAAVAAVVAAVGLLNRRALAAA